MGIGRAHGWERGRAARTHAVYGLHSIPPRERQLSKFSFLSSERRVGPHMTLSTWPLRSFGRHCCDVASSHWRSLCSCLNAELGLVDSLMMARPSLIYFYSQRFSDTYRPCRFINGQPKQNFLYDYNMMIDNNFKK